MTSIVIVGGADTGRAPMAAALLNRHIIGRGLDWQVGSAGVLGHDDDPPESEARDAMATLGLDIAAHRARSASDELVAEAALLVAVDSGTALVLRMRFADAAARIHVLDDLAGRKRDIPDPFRMQIGAWISYARELEALLRDALPRMIELLQTGDRSQENEDKETRRQGDKETRSQEPGARSQEPESKSVAISLQIDSSDVRQTSIGRLERLLHVAVELPDVIRWDAARAHIEAGIVSATTPLSSADLALAYAGVLRAALALSANPPTAGQLAALRAALGVLRNAVGQAEINSLSIQLGKWSSL